MVTVSIPLTQNKFALIDEDDLALVSPYRWRVLKGKKAKKLYAYTGGYPGVPALAMHRLIMNAPTDRDVDHINGDSLDNRRSNLRVATESENGANREPNRVNSSGYKGVTWQKNIGKWQAQIKCRGKNIYLGLYDDPANAALAYDSKALEVFGDFARLNFPKTGEA